MFERFKTKPTETALRRHIEGLCEGVAATLETLYLEKDRALAVLMIDPAQASAAEPLRHQVEQALRQQTGISHVDVVLTAERQGTTSSSSPVPEKLAPGIHQIIAVASGKGGVGKSTVAANLAVALAQQGQRVGLLDADIYGPSMPMMMGRHDKPQNQDHKLIPLEAHGVKVMSIGFLVDGEAPMIWRGPMVQSAIIQMLRDVAWGELDVLVVDMPPGTGDAQLTFAQKVPLAGAVIVSTPQDVALIDARKGLAMFQRTQVPILGIVENMSMFVCPHCGGESDIFGHGGARSEAERLGVPFLGEIPLALAIRQQGDQGVPIVAADPAGSYARPYQDMAAQVRSALQAGTQKPPPIIRFVD